MHNVYPVERERDSTGATRKMNSCLANLPLFNCAVASPRESKTEKKKKEKEEKNWCTDIYARSMLLSAPAWNAIFPKTIVEGQRVAVQERFSTFKHLNTFAVIKRKVSGIFFQ